MRKPLKNYKKIKMYFDLKKNIYFYCILGRDVGNERSVFGLNGQLYKLFLIIFISNLSLLIIINLILTDYMILSTT